MNVTNLPDDRRKNKPWLPSDPRDVLTGLVVTDSWGKPSCVDHGAMNRVDPHALIYRCSEQRCGVGAQITEAAS